MRYFFHLHNDIESFDEEGRELADTEAAHAHAVDEARVMASDSVRKGHLDLSHSVEVANEAKESLLKVTFGEAVKVTNIKFD